MGKFLHPSIDQRTLVHHLTRPLRDLDEHGLPYEYPQWIESSPEDFGENDPAASLEVLVPNTDPQDRDARVYLDDMDLTCFETESDLDTDVTHVDETPCEVYTNIFVDGVQLYQCVDGTYDADDVKNEVGESQWDVEDE